MEDMTPYERMAQRNQRLFAGPRSRQPADAERTKWDEVIAAAKERNQRQAIEQNKKLNAQRATDPVSAFIGPHLTSQALDVGRVAEEITPLGDPKYLTQGSRELWGTLTDPESTGMDVAEKAGGLAAVSVGALIAGVPAKGARRFSEEVFDYMRKQQGDNPARYLQVKMTGDDFGNLAAPQAMGPESRKLEAAQHLLKKGEPYNTPMVLRVKRFMDPDGKPTGEVFVVGHDGRHRNLAIPDEEVPVLFEFVDDTAKGPRITKVHGENVHGNDPTRIVEFRRPKKVKPRAGIEGFKLDKTGRPIGAPAHITSAKEVNRLTDKAVDYALQGKKFRNWYEKAEYILDATGGDVERTTNILAGAARLSANTGVDPNMLHTVKAVNQRLAGRKVWAGQFPVRMSADVEKALSGDIEGAIGNYPKVHPFFLSNKAGLDPKHVDDAVIDIHMGRLFEFTPQQLESSLSQTNIDFGKEILYRAQARLNKGINDPAKLWDVRQVQAASWVTQKSTTDKSSLEEAAFAFADALDNTWAILPWESMPGEVVDPSMYRMLADATDDVRIRFHQDIKRVLVDETGRDRVALGFGALTGKSFDAPAWWGDEASALGIKSRVAVAPQTGGGALEESSKDLIEAIELTRGRLLHQDAVAGFRVMRTTGTLVPERNGYAVQMGRVATPEDVTEANALAKKIADDFEKANPGKRPFIFADAMEDGVIVRNGTLEDPSPMPNKDFHDAYKKGITDNEHFSTTDLNMASVPVDGFYDQAEDYGKRIARLPPDLRRKVEEVYNQLSPEIEAVFGQTRKRAAGFKPQGKALAPPQGVSPDEINRKLLQPRGSGP